jgi:hypothetical protein
MQARGGLSDEKLEGNGGFDHSVASDAMTRRSGTRDVDERAEGGPTQSEWVAPHAKFKLRIRFFPSLTVLSIPACPRPKKLQNHDDGG